MNSVGRKVKILFIIPSLGGGGAERFLVNALKYLDKEHYQCSVALFRKEGPYLAELPGNIPVYDLKGGSPYSPINIFKLSIKLAHLIRREKPHIVFSILAYAHKTVLLARYLSFAKVKVILNEQIFTAKDVELSQVPLLKRILIKVLYPRADLIIAVSQGIKRSLIKDFGIPEGKIQVIYNPIDLEYVQKLAGESQDLPPHPWLTEEVPTIISVGRLVKQKGYDYLLRAFAKVQQRTPARLLILGEGEEKEHLQNLAARLGIAKDIAFLGFQKNPYKYMVKATVFVLSSLYEGFPNVLIEALALGVPIVATRCPSGPEEVIQDGRNGFLVEVGNYEALANAIIRILQDEGLRKQFSVNGKEVAKLFSIDALISQYATLLETFSK